MTDKRECVVCGGSMDHKQSNAIFCSNRCKQRDKYWKDPELYRQKAKDAYYSKPKEKAH